MHDRLEKNWGSLGYTALGWQLELRLAGGDGENISQRGNSEGGLFFVHAWCVVFVVFPFPLSSL